MIRRLALLGSAALALLACAGRNDATQADELNAAGAAAVRPWEIVSKSGETLVPNVFYADPSQNEQVMPYAIDGHVMIDRLVYPTLGNPNLYTKGDADDELTVVLRLEDASTTGLSFFLVPRGARVSAEQSTPIVDPRALRIAPDDVTVLPEPADMPAVLKQRHTLRVTFRQGALAHVPAGLYDIRFEQRTGGRTLVEYQYNAVSVADAEPEEYSFVDVTDTQVAMGSNYKIETRDKLEELVRFVNGTPDARVRNAPFVTFNGDLHNGGSPGLLGEPAVATQYADEAGQIVGLLKQLTKPIFLTAGNHDGFVSTGQVPAAVWAVDALASSTLHEIVAGVSAPWAGFSQNAYEAWLAQTKDADQLGGAHRDVFTGSFARRAGGEGFAGWTPVANRNYVLYDGFHQWQKTYGPLYASFRYGKNRYLSLNSFELRQHRRAGWGMYTVNYGGGMSDVQMDWLDRELARAKTEGSDVVMLAHHDPRGGHSGKDRGYYFEQVEYRSIYQSALNYVGGVYWNPAVCKLPSWALTDAQAESCLHDGLQEWMRPDAELDCAADQRTGAGGTCKSGAALWTSGAELLKRIAASSEARTLLLGHAHYNELEVLQAGDELLPGALPIDAGAVARFASLEVTNPFRGYSVQTDVAQTNNHRLITPVPLNPDYDADTLPLSPIEASYAAFTTQYASAMATWSRALPAATDKPRELVVLRMVSNADLSDQTYSDGKSALGFTVLDVLRKTDRRAVAAPQVNRAHFYVNVGNGSFRELTAVDIDRTTHLGAHDPQNPLQRVYKW